MSFEYTAPMRGRAFGTLVSVGALAASVASCSGGGTRAASTGQLEIVAQCQANTTPAEIEVAFMVWNASDAAIDYSDIKVRYYFSYQLASGATPVLDVAFTQYLPLSDITATFTSSYLELGFASTAGQLTGATNNLGSGQIQAMFHDSVFSNWDPSQADDYSFESCAGTDAATAFVQRPTMPAYVQGKLAWGAEP
jgi:cellulose 1,4-beta-cellobiosidase